MIDNFFTMFRYASYRTTAFRVAIVVGSVLFLINHGQALASGTMTRSRWLSATLTYFVPFTVSLHGQYQGHKRIKTLEKKLFSS